MVVQQHPLDTAASPQQHAPSVKNGGAAAPPRHTTQQPAHSSTPVATACASAGDYTTNYTLSGCAEIVCTQLASTTSNTMGSGSSLRP